jgi:hypothetical protein
MAMEAASPDGWDVPPATPEHVAAATAAAHMTFEEQGWAWEALPPWLGIKQSDIVAGVEGLWANKALAASPASSHTMTKAVGWAGK